MATEKRWTPYEYSPYAKEFRRDDGWQLFYVKPASAPFHWKVLMPGGIAPPQGHQNRNEELGIDKVAEAQDWADKLISDIENRFRWRPPGRII